MNIDNLTIGQAMCEKNRQHVLRYRAVMACLSASGTEYKNKEASIACLSTTVQAKKNIEIYELFVTNSK
ncbi:hypothetical protein ACGVWS_11785 [Enterobacteriaceae bacterium LUAb1]